MTYTLDLNSVMLGTMQPKELVEFYKKILGAPDWVDGGWSGWQVGSCNLTVGEHSEMGGQAKDPGRVMFNFETPDVKGEFERVKDLGATVVKEPYEMGGGWIATIADPDGNYFQLMSPWSAEEKSMDEEDDDE